MNIIPKLHTIRIQQHYNDGRVSPTCTSTPYHYWTGNSFYSWLWFKNIKRNFKRDKDFKVLGNEIRFTKAPAEDVSIDIIYGYERIKQTFYLKEDYYERRY